MVNLVGITRQKESKDSTQDGIERFLKDDVKTNEIVKSSQSGSIITFTVGTEDLNLVGIYTYKVEFYLNGYEINPGNNIEYEIHLEVCTIQEQLLDTSVSTLPDVNVAKTLGDDGVPIYNYVANTRMLEVIYK